MIGRRIRIDPAHKTFEYSSSSFETVLRAAQVELDTIDKESHVFATLTTDVANSVSDAVEDFSIQESINAELAMLASLQRRERFLRSKCEHSERVIAQTELGKKLAALHAASLCMPPQAQ